MLKYMYVSPSDFLIVLLGRGVARIAVGGMGALITLIVGVVLLGVPFDLAKVNWPLFIVVMALGLASIIAIGRDAGRDLPPDPTGFVVVPGGGRPARSSWSAARCSRSPSCRRSSRCSAC